MRKIAGVLPNKKIKAKVWREFTGFDPLKNGVFNYEETLQKIASVYNLDVKKVEAELDLAEVLPVFIECRSFINKIIFDKLSETAKKNGAD